jgi:hypothetical protein
VILFWPGAAWSVQRGDLLTKNRIVRGFIDIDLRPVRIVLRHIVVGEYGFDWTLGNARVAIDARIGVDIKAVGQFVKCLYRADRGTIRVLAVNTWFHHYIGHLGDAPFKLKIIYLFI